jgi:hypothetical protein
MFGLSGTLPRKIEELLNERRISPDTYLGERSRDPLVGLSKKI